MLRKHVLALTVSALTAVAAGCSSGITGPNPSHETALSADCQNPIHGNKYALCGHLSTASIAPPTGALNVIGSVDAKPGNSVGTQHTILGGTFHATH